MPEGPEVKQLCVDLRNRILNGYLIGVFHDGNSRYKSDGLPGINLLRSEKYLVKSVFTKGKHIFVQLEDCIVNDHVVYMEIRFGEAGRLSLELNTHCNIALSFEQTETVLNSQNSSTLISHDSFNLNTQDSSTSNSFTIQLVTKSFFIYFEDSRHRGAIEFKDKEDLDKKLKKLGPDLLSGDVPYELYFKIITECATRNPHWEICQFMMNQSKLSGIGNYLKADILYMCKIRPDRLLKDLSSIDIQNLYYYSIMLIKEAYDAGGLTIKNFYTIDGEVGAYKKRIYGKQFDDFRNPVIRTEYKDKRTSHWVPNVQI